MTELHRMKLLKITLLLVWAARNPIQHLSLIWFTVWSSVAHGGIMAVQSFVYPEHRESLCGDVPVLFLAAFLLAWLTPKTLLQNTKQKIGTQI